MINIIDWKNAEEELKVKILARSQIDISGVATKVSDIISEVRKDGDIAIEKYARLFDDPKFNKENIRVTQKEIDESYEKVGEEVVKIMKRQIEISRNYAETEKSNISMDWCIEYVPGVKTGLRQVPMDSVGLYVPAGKAPLPVVAQILTVPASVAGVARKVVCFPPSGNNYEIIVSAHLAGADEIYRVGGAVAIAALAYGTDTIAPVKFIAGPGSAYVQAAKMQVFRKVGIDMISGPSEGLIMADEKSNPRFIAADLLAKCEHGGDSAAVCVTNSKKLATEIQSEFNLQFKDLNRKQYIEKSAPNYSAIITVDTLDDMIDFANIYAAEHLEIQVENPSEILKKINNASSVFLGDYSPIAIGDYASGTNHCLPTGVAPSFSSAVGVRMFLRSHGYQELTKEGLKTLEPIINTLADIEGLDAHKKSVNIRFENDN